MTIQKIQSANSTRWFALALVVVLGLGVLWMVSPFLSGIIGAAILYVILVPVHRWLTRWIHPGFSAALLAIGAALLILGPGVWILTLIISESPNVAKRLLESDVTNRLQTLQIGGVALGAHVTQGANAMISWTSSHIFGVFGQVTAATLNLAIALIGLYFLLRSADELWAWARDLIPFSDENVEMLRVRFFSITQAMVLGTLLTSILQGTIVGVGFFVVGLPYPIFWGVVTGFASILPVFGSALVWLPGVVVLLAQREYGAAIGLAVIGAGIASNLDNVVRPIVYRRVSNLHPMTTLLGAFAGVAYFGLIGVLLGPLAISFFVELVEIYRSEY
jgi:predicted PurR-regulated permease PerM